MKKTITFRKKIYNILYIISIISIIIIAIVITKKYYFGNNIRANNWIKDIKIVNGKDNKTNSKTYRNEDVLVNPGKGFVLRDSLEDSCDNILSVVYYRFGWSTIEPEEGQYNWSIIDSKIRDCTKRGKKFAFGIMNVCISSPKEYVTPEWVFDAGAQFHIYESSDGVKHVIPEWTDKIFLEKLNNFIEVLAERYDGNENIAFIDIRSYGSYGEQHLTTIGGTDISSEQLKELFIQPYMNAFNSTMLVNPWGKEMYNDTYEWAVDNGVTIRRDGIMQLYNGKQIFEYAYGKLPTIFEYFYSYKDLKQNGLWNTEKLLDYVETWHPSYIEIFPEMYEENKDFCDMIANKIGYYFRFNEAEYTNTIELNSSNNISLKFINEGVAPLYEDCTVYIGLLDENYNLVKKYKTDIDPHTWMPNKEKIENINITFDDVQLGNYIISVGLFLNENDEKPTYLLGNSGKTNDNWYVFGTLDITEKQEIYNINLKNQDYFVNNNNEYVVNVTIDNLSTKNKYTIERYLDNTLIDNFDITNLEGTYSNSFKFRLSEENNKIKVVIKKNEEEVAKLEKDIYIYSAQEKLNAISNTALQKYAEFEEKFSAELESIDGLQEQINKLKNYMSSIANNKAETQEKSIEMMHEHFYLGTMILDSFNKDKLNVEYVKVSSMLDMLNDIGNSYEDLLTVSATSREAYYKETEKLLNKAETTINNNSDLNILYPSKILDFAKELHDKSKYIIGLEEENDIKTGLIVSNSLHAYYLADWANDFANIYVNKYIKENPVTVSHSNTDEFTNKDLTVTLNIGSDSKVINNEGKNTYTFNKNGTFTFEYERRGQAFKQEITITNIDKEAPIISGIVNGKIYTNSVKPVITDKNLAKVEVLFNGISIQFNSGNTLKEEGIYNITATDKAGNSTSIEMYIVEKGKDGYVVDGEHILNVRQETKVEQFAKKFNLSTEYTIKRNNNNLLNTDIIATGDILQLKNGSQYTIIVAGDINRDGKVTTYDLSTFRRYILNLREFDKLEEMAADINVDKQELGVKDYTRMRIEILGEY